MKKTSFKELTDKVQLVIKGYGKSYLIIVIFCILAAIFNSIAPYFLGLATDSLYESFTNEIAFDMPYITKILIVVLACYILNSICTYLKRKLLNAE